MSNIHRLDFSIATVFAPLEGSSRLLLMISVVGDQRVRKQRVVALKRLIVVIVKSSVVCQKVSNEALLIKVS